MNTKPKASSDDFAALLGNTSPTTEPPKPKTSKKAKPAAKPKPVEAIAAEQRGRGRPAKLNANDAQTTFYYPSALRKRLKEQALHEDCSVNDLLLEGLELMFAKRGIDPYKKK